MTFEGESQILSQLCLQVTEAITSDDDVLPSLTELRRLLSNERFIENNKESIQANPYLVDTVLILATAVETSYLDLGLVIEEFTWLMINVPHLCSIS